MRIRTHHTNHRCLQPQAYLRSTYSIVSSSSSIAMKYSIFLAFAFGVLERTSQEPNPEYFASGPIGTNGTGVDFRSSPVLDPHHMQASPALPHFLKLWGWETKDMSSFSHTLCPGTLVCSIWPSAMHGLLTCARQNTSLGYKTLTNSLPYVRNTYWATVLGRLAGAAHQLVYHPSNRKHLLCLWM